jgi:hypothetical protein
VPPLLQLSLALVALALLGVVAIRLLAGESLGVAAARLLCDGEVQVDRRSYSYKPGQRGEEVRFYCVTRGQRQDMTDRLVNTGLATGAVVLLVPIALLVVVAPRLSRRDRRGG